MATLKATILVRLLDKPIAGLLTDSKQRGLLDSTLMVQQASLTNANDEGGVNGRSLPNGYSIWLAGGVFGRL